MTQLLVIPSTTEDSNKIRHTATPPSVRSRAKSGRGGTVVPRKGVFWGTKPPKRHALVVAGESNLGEAPGSVTPVASWRENHIHSIKQTSPIDGMDTISLRLKGFRIQIPAIFSWDFTDEMQPGGPFQGQAPTSMVRLIDAAMVGFSESSSTPDPMVKRLRAGLETFRDAIEPIVEAIATMLRPEPKAAIRHVGLNAVARISSVLGVPRVQVLKMAGIPESTFYSWQNRPRSEVRGTSVRRLLRLEATLALLSDTMGADQARNWLHVGKPNRVTRLQASEASFTAVLSEADAYLSERATIRARRRLSADEYGESADTTAPSAVSQGESTGTQGQVRRGPYNGNCPINLI